MYFATIENLEKHMSYVQELKLKDQSKSVLSMELHMLELPVSALSSTVATSPMQLLSTYNIANVTQELIFKLKL